MMLLPLLLTAAPALFADTLRPASALSVMDLSPAGVVAPVPGAAAHPIASPAEVGLRLSELLRAEEQVAAEVARGAFPGAALVVGRWDRTVVERGYGRLDWALGSPAVDVDRTVYDVASLTKVVATTTAVMLLVEDGRMELDAPVSRYLPGFAGGAKDRVTVRHLLAHTSGLPAWADLWARSPEASLARAVSTPLATPPGTRVEYSDVGFVLLYAAAEAAAAEPLYRLLDTRVFGPLGMRSTTYLPGAWCERCAPTERRRDGSAFRGVVHDPIARHLGGITGNAGLFSTAHDLARFAAMLAGEGELEGVRVLRRETIREFTRRQPGAGTRALGWDTPDPSGRGAAGLQVSLHSYGHTGFTGTSLWVDPERGTWTVLLSNRTYAPRARNQIQALRRTLHDRVAAAADDGTTLTR